MAIRGGGPHVVVRPGGVWPRLFFFDPKRDAPGAAVAKGLDAPQNDTVSNRSPDVEARFDDYDNPQKDLVLAVRAVMLDADPRLGECIKWKAPTVTYRGNLASFFPNAKKHVALMFHTGASLEDPFHLLEGEGAKRPSRRSSPHTPTSARRPRPFRPWSGPGSTPGSRAGDGARGQSAALWVSCEPSLGHLAKSYVPLNFSTSARDDLRERTVPPNGGG